MIHLDTNFLIRAARRGSREGLVLRRWLVGGELVRVSAIAWAEFLCGPVTTREIEDAAEVFGEPAAFGPLEATLAAQLFNASGRRRNSLPDCMIAASALNAGAALATSNVADFERFASHGLVLEVP